MENNVMTDQGKKKRGRPSIDINWELMDGILQFGARLIDCRELLGVSDDTIQKAIRAKFDLSFSEYREQKMSKMRMKLLQKQFDSAMSGNTALLIFLGKQYLGQTEKISTKNEHDFSEAPSFEVKFVQKVSKVEEQKS